GRPAETQKQLLLLIEGCRTGSAGVYELDAPQSFLYCPAGLTTMPEAFPNIPKIEYEGPKSKNPLAFRWYNPEEIVEGRKMKYHLRFSVTYWHTFRGMGADMFGSGTMQRPWEAATDSVENAKNRVRVAFEFF